jgi:hypothetical protein
VENPIRHGALKRLRGPQRVTREAWAGIAVATLVCAAALAGMAGVGAVSRANTPGELTVATTLEAGEVAEDADSANRTSCRDGTHIGDSTSEGLISPDYLPNVKQQIPATFGRVGIERLNVEISGARSIYETYEGAPNAEDVALSWKDQGFDGCWVFALGTNEAANVAAGSNIGYDERIDTMMDAVDGDPVLWVNVRTLDAAGPYAEANMAAWNRALLAACDEYPNMRIYDWASDVRDDWFIEDGIHFTTPGYAARSRLIASALLESFPANGAVVRTPDQSCVIHPSGELPEAPKQGSGAGINAGI